MVFVLVVGGCFAVVLNIDTETAGRETLATPNRGPATSKPTAPPSDAATAPEEQPAGDASGDGPAAIGSAITLQGLDSDVQVDAAVTQIFDPATSENDFIKPKAGARWVAVEMQLKNTGTAVYTDAPSIGLKLIDAEGQQYSQTFGDVKEGEVFSSITANPGDTRKGVVLFEVPDGAKLAKLQFALNTGFASEKGEWAIP
ncbi:DUF4352 domain-containing protein [Herbidospora sp. NEAU-GS84]|uniref:DUF4352 domain-containing protein n=1 Tax=Herbidospora solisilvae TaxID=2696284 RepID=A0A7C9NMY2_9ACTN|nr:DUF4352 domain-containing protein [Herbidospora solisilvae]NAS22516.1 DUF4352 domain-containing protein [Herbidospora solisilvae]